MSSKLRFRRIRVCRVTGAMAIGMALSLLSALASADTVWSGDFNGRNFLNYHSTADPNKVFFFAVSDYGRPPQYGAQQPGHIGNGDLLNLVSSPTRGGQWAARFTVKNSRNGREPQDCDIQVDCKTRRTSLAPNYTFIDYYKAMPYKAERWWSVSVFLPSDFDTSGPGWGPVVAETKAYPWNAAGPQLAWLGVALARDSWTINHRFLSKEMKQSGVDLSQSHWLSIGYKRDFPSNSDWPQGLVDFPDIAASQAALGNLNRGGWTDFVFHWRTDADTVPFSNNTGFLDAYMRAGDGEWVQVLRIRPMQNLQTAEFTPSYNRGIGQWGTLGGGQQIGLYMSKERVWSNIRDMTVYIDNNKIGDARSTFEEMTHDGSSLDGEPVPPKPRPNPPLLDSD